MSTDETVTPKVDSSATLRVEDLRPKLDAYLSERAKLVFKNQRSSMSVDLMFYGRLVNGEVTYEHHRDFAERLNKLFDTFSGSNSYPYKSGALQPSATSSLAVPMGIPLAPLGTRRCRECNGAVVGALCRGTSDAPHEFEVDFVVDNPVMRTMFLAYVFVDGIDDISDIKERRAWLDDLTRGFIVTHGEGELPVNTKD